MYILQIVRNAERLLLQPTKPVLIGKHAKYAGALYKFAETYGIQEQVGADLAYMGHMVTSGHWNSLVLQKQMANFEEADIREEKGEARGDEFLSQKAQVALLESEIFEANDFHPMSQDLLRELFLNQELGALNGIAETYDQIYRYQNNVFECTITSAQALTAAQTDRIKAKVATFVPPESDVLYYENVDPSLIGGLTVEIDDTMLDLSTSSQISSLLDLVRVQGFPEMQVAPADLETFFADPEVQAAQ
jgi:ATP synthase F1 delta subunit